MLSVNCQRIKKLLICKCLLWTTSHDAALPVFESSGKIIYVLVNYCWRCSHRGKSGTAEKVIPSNNSFSFRFLSEDYRSAFIFFHAFNKGWVNFEYEEFLCRPLWVDLLIFNLWWSAIIISLFKFSYYWLYQFLHDLSRITGSICDTLSALPEWLICSLIPASLYFHQAYNCCFLLHFPLNSNAWEHAFLWIAKSMSIRLTYS